MSFRPTSVSPAASANRVIAVIAIAALLCLTATTAFAASGSSRGGVTAGPTGPATTDPFLLTHIVKVAVVAVDLEAGKFTVRDLETEKLHELAFHADLPMRAKSKKDFGGRRKLTPEDIAAGQLLKLTVRDADGAVLKLRVEKLKET